jgi:hypothetical protein
VLRGGPIHDIRQMMDTRGRLLTPTVVQPGTLRFPAAEVRHKLVLFTASTLASESLSAMQHAVAPPKVLTIHVLHGLKYYLFRPFLKVGHSPTNWIWRGPLGDAFHDGLGIKNSYGGYAFLVDGDGFVRWSSSGGLSMDELRTFEHVASDVLGAS